MNLKPIKPLEPLMVDEIPNGPEWIHQIKWDGVRILVYFDGREVQLFNRKMNERTHNYPEITDIKSYCTAHSVILDGEMIALGADGRPSFHEVMRRDGIRRYDRVPSAMKAVPIYYMIFDILYLNGEWLNVRPLKDRIYLLPKVIIPNDTVQLVSTQTDGEGLFDVIKNQDMEGIVSKRLDSTYAFGGKDLRWRKIKNYKDLIAVIGGVTYRQGIVNSVLIGLYNERKELVYIGHAGTGKLSAAEWGALTRLVESLKIEESPFVNEHSRGVQWIRPKLTAKIQYIEWPEGHNIRQPSIQAFVKTSPEECKINANH